MTIPPAVVASSVVFTTTLSPALAFFVSSLLSSSPFTGRKAGLFTSGLLAVLGTGTAESPLGCVPLGVAFRGVPVVGEFGAWGLAPVCCATRGMAQTAAIATRSMVAFFIVIENLHRFPAPRQTGGRT